MYAINYPASGVNLPIIREPSFVNKFDSVIILVAPSLTSDNISFFFLAGRG